MTEMFQDQPKDSLNKVIGTYYRFQFFFSLLLWVPIFYEFQKRIGLSESQIFGIQSIYYAAFCFLEIPTGYIADRFGYLLTLRSGALVLLLSNLLPVVAPSYSGMLWHFLGIALARSLISGASSAYVYDYLQAHRRASEFKQVEGNARAYGLVGRVLCWAGVGALLEWHLSLPYSLTALSALVSFFYAWRLPALSEQAEPSLESRNSGQSDSSRPGSSQKGSSSRGLKKNGPSGSRPVFVAAAAFDPSDGSGSIDFRFGSDLSD